MDMNSVLKQIELNTVSSMSMIAEAYNAVVTENSNLKKENETVRAENAALISQIEALTKAQEAEDAND